MYKINNSSNTIKHFLKLIKIKTRYLLIVQYILLTLLCHLCYYDFCKSIGYEHTVVGCDAFSFAY